MTEIRNPKPVLEFEYLEFEIYLLFGAWDLKFYRTGALKSERGINATLCILKAI